MKLYLDDDVAKGSLVARLRKVGHQVVVPADVRLSGNWDPRHLLHAVQHGLVLLTKNHDDFKDLHLLIQATNGSHPGIVVIRADNDPQRDMKDGECHGTADDGPARAPDLIPFRSRPKRSRPAFQGRQLLPAPSAVGWSGSH